MGNMETQFKYATRTDATHLETYRIGDRIPWKELGGVYIHMQDLRAATRLRNPA
ncbi:MAG: hypothetical protein FD175_3077 [Beijerinckiaceae bacterium]|nr:MAG: hypothetical protein FD175_3077 [Beijerinckiaceae bacterium]